MTTLQKAAVVTREDGGKLRVSRRFDAPRDLVWRAYTQPELVKRWMEGDAAWEMTQCEMDVREGGTYRWRWKQKDGTGEFGFHGTYHEITAPERIVNDEYYDPGTIGGSMGDYCDITLTLEEADGATMMTTLMDFHTEENRETAMSTGMSDGMEFSYQHLDKLLEKI